MKVRRMFAVAAVLMTAAVGLAIGSTGSAAGSSQNQGSRPQDTQMRPPRGPGGARPGGPEPMLFDLDLTTAQLEQIKTLTAAEREAEAGSRDQLREIGDEMRSLVEADKFDEAAVRELAAKEAALIAELRVTSARTESAIYQLLTADQKAALAKLRDQQPLRPPLR